MINPEVLLSDLKKLLGQLEDDLRERIDVVPTLAELLRSAHQRAKQAERTAQPFETWCEEYLTQAAVAWVLACVFVRFIEDNGLINAPLLAGSGSRLGQAKDQRTLYFQQHPTDSDREYLYYVFRTVKSLPAAAPLFDERHNPLWAIGVSGDGATLLVEFWQRIDPATGALAHDFVDPALNTRFLGDLYQDLSEAARKKYALLQTPEFVEEFILDRTLTPAIAEFGLVEVRLIDPACGSGHFLLGAFHRLLREWQMRDPAVNARELAQRALDAVAGVDLNPYAVAIARFRLLIAALKSSDVRRLVDAPAFRMNLATGDSLLHGPRPGGERQMYLAAEADPLRHVYDTEDATELRRILGTRYHVVVGNPPYIAVRDRALSEAYRRRFGSCHMKYSLAVPFMERFFDLAIEPHDGNTELAGYIGTITTNSFMKREFGKKLIEQYIPRWDLTHVIDTSGAYIPGHGTPTVILFGRHRKPVSETVRAVLGIRGEPQAPDDPSRGLVWLAIVNQVDRPGSQSAFISAVDISRAAFHSHPWSIGGGGAAELKTQIDEAGTGRLQDSIESIGFAVITGEDDALLLPDHVARRQGLPVRPFVTGEQVRDWSIASNVKIVFPYKDSDLSPYSLDEARSLRMYLWPLRQLLAGRSMFGKSPQQHGLEWFEYLQFIRARISARCIIPFAFVATHNHFALDRGGKVFNRSAPVITLRPEASDDDHVALLGLLNSSTACFWMKQVFFPKGGDHVGQAGARVRRTWWDERYEFDGTKLKLFPVVEVPSIDLATKLLALGAQAEQVLDDAMSIRPVSAADLAHAHRSYLSLLGELIGLQEELDWLVYSCYGLTDAALVSSATPPLRFGQRAFEFVLARRIASGELETSWFERHQSTPSVEFPSDWPAEYRELVEKRVAVIERDADIALIEQPEYKRRWNTELWEQRKERALREWLLARMEAQELWTGGELTSVGRLADRVRREADFMQVAELYRGRADFDVTALVADLVESDAVPFLPVLRYKPTGLRKRAAWEHTWELQRREDAKEEIDEIPEPPKYTSTDFLDFTFWSLRGKLDVPKERFISYPYAEREADATPVIGWAGWDHLQQAKALAGYYVRMKEREGWQAERLKPLLAGLLELLPWMKQWHNELDPSYGIGMGDYFAGFVDEEARALGFTLDDVRAWQPPSRNSRRRRRASV